MRRLVLLTMVLASLLAAGCGGSDQGAASGDEGQGGSAASAQSDGRGGSTAASGRGGAATEVVRINASGGETVEVRAEIADNDAERQRGLMERTALAEDAGMLFVFGFELPRSFWMRNTLIPLSIAYIDSEGRIVDLQDMEPLDDEPPHYASAEPAQYALEVNQGFFDDNGVEVGDTVELPET